MWANVRLNIHMGLTGFSTSGAPSESAPASQHVLAFCGMAFILRRASTLLYFRGLEELLAGLTGSLPESESISLQ